ncbi:YciI family protein [Rosenbergiella australiborealis]|uniref:YciI family protein n=1 Tax=Rosenbergiella australiborealis TaxID=1544696 RepID=A0ABS5T1X5_9GAMM|nr:YciI family protein [Rosenbergiella australiborealis]
MLYVIYAEDNKDSLEKRLTVRAAHLARLQILKDEDRLVVAGPMPIADSEETGHAGFSGSVIIAEFASLDDAQMWANDDPYVAAGIYQTVTVRPFKRVF